MTWRIGSVPYLNAKPLIWGLDSDPAVQLTLLPPSKLAPLLTKGRLDVALLPVFEVLRLKLGLVPGLAVASPGETASVLLHLKKPLKQLKCVALDENSRTTNALARILLQRRYGLKPTYVTHDPETRSFVGDATIDAAVTIGDASFRDYGFPALDLGAAWKDFTGLPFVFAVWAYRRRDEELEARLKRAAILGGANVATIVKRNHARVGLTPAECRSYLMKNISYILGPDEQVGMKLFEKHARQLGLIGR